LQALETREKRDRLNGRFESGKSSRPSFKNWSKPMHTLWQDLRYGARMMRTNPGFSIVAVLALALGIGGNTAIFSVVHAVLLRPLPYSQPDRLVVVSETLGGRPMPVSYPNFLDWSAENQTFEGLAAWAATDFNLTGAAHAERVLGEEVSDNYFDLIGVHSEQGRTFLPEENRTSGSHPVVVVSHGFWQRRLGGEPNIVGRTLRVNELQCTIVGITPQGFEGFSDEAEVWVPMMMQDALSPQTARFHFLQTRDIHWHRVLARMKPGVTVERAQSDLGTIAARLGRDYPESNEGRGARVVAAQENLAGGLRTPLLVLLGAVGFVLLIACANVANLTLVRAAARNREIAIRVALGAGRRRVIRQLLTESMLIASLGGGLGLLFALWGTDLLVSILPITLPRFAAIGVSGTVLGFTGLVSLLAGVALGLAPALQASRPNLNEALKAGNKLGGGPGGHRVRNVLVVVEFALALMLMIGAGLMLKSFQRLLNSDLGFRGDHLLMLRFDVPNKKYEGEGRSKLGQRLVDQVESVAGVESASATVVDPFIWGGINRSYTIEGRPPVPPAERDTVYFHDVTPKYFRTMGIPLLEGRDFTAQDHGQSTPVTIVTESFARRYWPEKEALGKLIKFGPEESSQPWMTVVGVAKDAKFSSLRQNPTDEPVMYTPLMQSSVITSLSLLVRTTGDPSNMIPTLRRSIQEFDPDIPVYSVATMQQRMGEQASETRSYALLLGLFAALALVLSAIGIYGVMAYVVTQRTHEIGIRIALGAQRQDVLRLVVGEGIILALVGIATGLGGSLLLTRLINSLLYGVSATDPTVFTIIALMLLAVAFLACYIPARRATGVDPMVALRYE
jgi:predicted permease